MIFVTVSTGPFDRLIKSVDMLAPSLNEEVVMQIGGTTYEPKNYRYFRLCSRKEIVDY